MLVTRPEQATSLQHLVKLKSPQPNISFYLANRGYFTAAALGLHQGAPDQMTWLKRSRLPSALADYNFRNSGVTRLSRIPQGHRPHFQLQAIRAFADYPTDREMTWLS